MAKGKDKVRIIIKVPGEDKEACSFKSITLTRYLKRKKQGDPIDVYFEEKGFAEQFVGNYIVKCIPVGPEEPP